MPRKRRFTPLTVTDDERAQLERTANSTSLPRAFVRQERKDLASAKDLADTDIGRFAGASSQAVGKWRKRYRADSQEGLHNEHRPSCPVARDNEDVVQGQVVNRALQEKLARASPRSIPSLGTADRADSNGAKSKGKR